MEQAGQRMSAAERKGKSRLTAIPNVALHTTEYIFGIKKISVDEKNIYKYSFDVFWQGTKHKSIGSLLIGFYREDKRCEVTYSEEIAFSQPR